MKYNYYKYIFIFCLLFLIFILYVNSLQHVEDFTPYMRTIYRPYMRNVRIVSEGFISNQKLKFVNFLRKIGIL
jgi:hypothetical protein